MLLVDKRLGKVCLAAGKSTVLRSLVVCTVVFSCEVLLWTEDPADVLFVCFSGVFSLLLTILVSTPETAVDVVLM